MTSAIFKDRGHFLVEQLILMIDLVLAFLLYPMLSTRGLEHLAKFCLIALMWNWIGCST